MRQPRSCKARTFGERRSARETHVHKESEWIVVALGQGHACPIWVKAIMPSARTFNNTAPFPPHAKCLCLPLLPTALEMLSIIVPRINSAPYLKRIRCETSGFPGRSTEAINSQCRSGRTGSRNVLAQSVLFVLCICKFDSLSASDRKIFAECF